MTVGVAALVLRMAGGAIFVGQGFRKLFADPDAPHGRRGLERMIVDRGLPRARALALLVGWIELVCGLALVAGLLTRVAAIPLAGTLIIAIGAFKWRVGFLGGWDWPLSVLAIVIAIFLLGPGPLSLDALLSLEGP